jgi:inosine-uridine nucleoside N-ribohydrolase
METKIPVIIDTDPATGYIGRDVDDGLAIIAMLQDPRVEVLGLTVTFGNVSLSRGVRKAKQIAKFAGRPELPILAGAESKLLLDKPSEASDFLVKMSQLYQKRLVVLAIGPLTNIATAGCSYQFWSRLSSLVVLGGTLTKPAFFTQQNGFEFNLRQDIAAARRVFQYGEHLSIFPMEPCREIRLGWRDLFSLYQRGGAFAWAARQSILWEALSPLLWLSCGFHPWDVLAAFYVLSPSWFDAPQRLVRLGPYGELYTATTPTNGFRSMNVIERVRQFPFL